MPSVVADRAVMTVVAVRSKNAGRRTLHFEGKLLQASNQELRFLRYALVNMARGAI
jgi:hypothetical protein